MYVCIYVYLSLILHYIVLNNLVSFLMFLGVWLSLL